MLGVITPENCLNFSLSISNFFTAGGRSSSSPIFWFHGRKEEHFLKSINQINSAITTGRRNQAQQKPHSCLNIVGVREKHSQTVNTQTPSSSGRQSIFKRITESLINDESFIVSCSLVLWKQLSCYGQSVDGE